VPGRRLIHLRPELLECRRGGGGRGGGYRGIALVVKWRADGVRVEPRWCLGRAPAACQGGGQGRGRGTVACRLDAKWNVRVACRRDVGWGRAVVAEEASGSRGREVR
jgi:hypothetical protein